jgi:hypothetical protein
LHIFYAWILSEFGPFFRGGTMAAKFDPSAFSLEDMHLRDGNERPPAVNAWFWGYL